VGLSLVPDVGSLLIKEVLPGTPAERAGMVAGDRIVAVDGVTMGELERAVGKLRGKVGDPVVLTVAHAGRAGLEQKDLTLVREIIRVRAVTIRRLPDGVLVVVLSQFQDRVASDLVAALAGEERAHGKPRGIVLDLRGNPGGLLDQAIAVSDVFLPDGIVVSTRGRDGQGGDVARSSSGDRWDAIPLVVLVDAGTASAAEIVAGALQDRHRAHLVGQRTYGKGSVQSIFPLGDGSALKLTVSRYFTPSGRSIQETGITPDLEVAPAPDEPRALTPVDREENQDHHLGGKSGQGALPAVPRPPAPVRPAAGTPVAGGDKELDAAVELLETELGPVVPH
jgi:carboxyl-terminal processing protease